MEKIVSKIDSDGLSTNNDVALGSDGSINVSISIVTYNSANEINGVLSSLKQSDLSGVSVKVYVVDNGSTDNTVSIIKEKYPEVIVIENKQNMGFGAAHNVAINKASSKYHIIVNPDITFLDDTILGCVSYMEKNPDTLILTPRTLNDNKERSEQFLPKRRPKIKYLIGGVFENKSKMCKRLRGEYTMQDKKDDEPCEIDFCTGCFMFCRTDGLKKVGGFDEKYFLYFEDADLTRKIQKIGKTVFVPSIQVVHEWKRNNHRNWKCILTSIRSMMIYFGKWKIGIIKK